MKKLRISGFILFISIFSFGIMITNCTKKDENTKNAEEKPSVVTTTGMIADAAKNIGGNLIDVTALMGAGVDPHLYKASAKDVDRLAKAQLILYGGLHLEGKMSDVLKKFGELKPTLAVAECIPEEKLLGGENQGLHDPHVWFDVALWMVAVDAVRDSLVSLLPEDAAAIEENYTEYVAKLAKLHVYMMEKTAEIPEDMRIMITAHDAFEYFGRAYGFEVKGLQGISTVSEAGTRDVQDLASYIAKKKIPAIFVESSVPKKNVEALQAAVHARGWDVEIGGELFSDAMGDSGTFEGTYVGMLTHNINTIAGALSKK